MDGTEAVFRVTSFVSSFFVFSFYFPDAFLIEREGTPAVALKLLNIDSEMIIDKRHTNDFG
jgi:hypothetical protein